MTKEEKLDTVRWLTELYDACKNQLDNATDDAKREILRTFIKSVVVRGDDLHIEVLLPPIETPGSANNGFAGQPPHLLSRKHIQTLFLKTKLIPSHRHNRTPKQRRRKDGQTDRLRQNSYHEKEYPKTTG